MKNVHGEDLITKSQLEREKKILAETGMEPVMFQTRQAVRDTRKGLQTKFPQATYKPLRLASDTGDYPLGRGPYVLIHVQSKTLFHIAKQGAS